MECNIVFNQDDANASDKIAIIHGGTQSEGGNDKIIQAPLNNDESLENPENRKSADQQHQEDEPEPHQSPKLSNSVPFSSADNPQPDSEISEED